MATNYEIIWNSTKHKWYKHYTWYIRHKQNSTKTCDYEYLTATAHKTKTMLAVADQILQSYVTESTRNENKSRMNDFEIVVNKGWL